MNRRHKQASCSCEFDLDLDPMTLIYERDLDILQMYRHIKNELSRSKLSKVTALQTDTQTYRQTDTHTHTHTHMRLKTFPRRIRWC